MGECISKRIACCGSPRKNRRVKDLMTNSQMRRSLRYPGYRSSYNHIAEILTTQSMLESLSKIKDYKIRIQSRHFTLISGKLHQQGTNIMLRNYINIGEVPKVLEATHDSHCEGHFVGMLMAHKTLWAGYYWPTMFKDFYEYARKCHSCQQYSRKDLRFSLLLQPYLYLALFENWGIDYVDQMHPISSEQMSCIVVAMKYLT